MGPKKKLRRTAGRPIIAESEARRDAVLEVATRVFLERGFSGTSMTEIARQAGASKGTLYALYPNKTELFVGLFRRRLAKRITPSDRESMIALDCPIEEALERMGMKLLSWVGSEEGRRWVRLVITESERFPELVKLVWKSGAGNGQQGRNAILTLSLRSRAVTHRGSTARSASVHGHGDGHALRAQQPWTANLD